jgi:hypothetical protein
MNNPIFTFAHSAELLTPVVERYGCGWFDGGCYIFARALQLWLGGCLAVLVRQELLDKQAFDHVVLRVDNSPDCRETLYIDADGVATRSALLKRWRTREGLTSIHLEDPADTIRFVGHLHNHSLSIWLAEQLRVKFGNPDWGWLSNSATQGTSVRNMSKAKEQFEAVVRNIPQYCAVFRVVRVRPWMASLGVKRGQEFRVYPALSDSAWWVRDRLTTHLSVIPYTLKFVRYEQVDKVPWK